MGFGIDLAKSTSRAPAPVNRSNLQPKPAQDRANTFVVHPTRSLVWSIRVVPRRIRVDRRRTTVPL